MQSGGSKEAQRLHNASQLCSSGQSEVEPRVRETYHTARVTARSFTAVRRAFTFGGEEHPVSNTAEQGVCRKFQLLLAQRGLFRRSASMAQWRLLRSLSPMVANTALRLVQHLDCLHVRNCRVLGQFAQPFRCFAVLVRSTVSSQARVRRWFAWRPSYSARASTAAVNQPSGSLGGLRCSLHPSDVDVVCPRCNCVPFALEGTARIDCACNKRNPLKCPFTKFLNRLNPL